MDMQVSRALNCQSEAAFKVRSASCNTSFLNKDQISTDSQFSSTFEQKSCSFKFKI